MKHTIKYKFETEFSKNMLKKIKDYFNNHSSISKSEIKNFLDYLNLCEPEQDENVDTFNSDISMKKPLELKKKGHHKNSNSVMISKTEPKFFGLDIMKSTGENYMTIDYDDINTFELYKLLATLDFNENNVIAKVTLDNLLKEYKFIHLTSEQITTMIQNIFGSKSTNIKKDSYIKLMEKMIKSYMNKSMILEEKKHYFSDFQLDYPEIDNFNYFPLYMNLFIKLLENIILLYNKYEEASKLCDETKKQFYNKHFKIYSTNIKFFINEVLELYNEQVDKFKEFKKINTEKINSLNEDINNLKHNLEKIQFQNKNDVLDLMDEIKEKSVVNANIFEENKELKNKYNIIYLENEKLKTEKEELNMKLNKNIETINS